MGLTMLLFGALSFGPKAPPAEPRRRLTAQAAQKGMAQPDHDSNIRSPRPGSDLDALSGIRLACCFEFGCPSMCFGQVRADRVETLATSGRHGRWRLRWRASPTNGSGATRSSISCFPPGRQSVRIDCSSPTLPTSGQEEQISSESWRAQLHPAMPCEGGSTSNRFGRERLRRGNVSLPKLSWQPPVRAM